MDYNTSARLFVIFFCFWIIARNGSQVDQPRNNKPTKEQWLEKISNITFANLNGTSEWPEFAQKRLESLTIPEASTPNNLYYRNMSGILNGLWENKVINETTKWYNGTLSPEKNSFGNNERGSLYFFANGRRTEITGVNHVLGFVKFTSEINNDFIELEGIHLAVNGTFYLYGYKEQHLGVIERILNVMPDNETFTSAKSILTKRYEDKFNDIVTEEDIIQVCEYYVMGQLGALDGSISEYELEHLEQELENPTGEKAITPPPLQSKLFFFSNNCNTLITTIMPNSESNSTIAFATGLKKQIYEGRVTITGFLAAMIGLALLYLFIAQIEFTPTHSIISKVSAFTIGLSLLADSYLCLIFFSTGLSIPRAFVALCAASFFPFVTLSVFGFKYIIAIRNTQRIEGGSSSDTSDNVGSTYFLFYVCLLLGMFIMYWYSLVPSAPILYTIFGVLFILFSLWIPQIVRNVRRGTTGGLKMNFVLFSSLLRLLYPTYFFLYPDNIYFLSTSKFVYVLYAWIFIQIVILYSQEVFGARFFIPKRFLPQSYNYHPVLAEADEESSLAADDDSNDLEEPEDDANDAEAAPQAIESTSYLVAESSTTADQGEASSVLAAKNKVCAVCMLPVDLKRSKTMILNRVNYMVTPCHHVFHTPCLSDWMRIKLECPICRTPLPPV